MEIRTRSEWGARPPHHVDTVNPGSSRALVGHHSTGATLGDPDYDAWCRNIQAFHMNPVEEGGRGWNDIAYNFLVDPHGVVREGRGWESRNAANRYNHEANRPRKYENGNTVSVCLLGMGDDTRVFTDAVKVAVRELLDIHNYIHGPGTELIGHRDIASTACPGDAFYQWLHAGAPPARSDGLAEFFRAVEAGEIVQLTDGQWVWAAEAVEVVPGLIVHAAHAEQVAADLWALAHPDEAQPRPAAAAAPAIPIPPTRTFEEELVDQLPTLAQGADGFHVRRVQALVNIFTTQVKIDGDFGPRTADAVSRVQAKFGLAEDGVVGPATWGVLVTAPDSKG